MRSLLHLGSIHKSNLNIPQLHPQARIYLIYPRNVGDFISMFHGWVWPGTPNVMVLWWFIYKLYSLIYLPINHNKIGVYYVYYLHQLSVFTNWVYATRRFLRVLTLRQNCTTWLFSKGSEAFLRKRCRNLGSQGPMTMFLWPISPVISPGIWLLHIITMNVPAMLMVSYIFIPKTTKITWMVGV